MRHILTGLIFFAVAGFIANVIGINILWAVGLILLTIFSIAFVREFRKVRRSQADQAVSDQDAWYDEDNG